MSNMKKVFGKVQQSGLKWMAIVVLLAAFVCSLWVNFTLRMPVEVADKTVGLLVDYDELKRIADTSLDIEFSDMIRKSSLSGATGLVVRERLLADWEIAGDITVYSGGQLIFQLELQHGESAKDMIADLGIIPNKTYVLTKDPLVYEQLFSLLEAKRRYPEPFDYPGYMGIVTSLLSAERATLGMGFPLAHLEQAAQAGFQIIPRIRNWEPVTAANLGEVFGWVAKIPNLAAIGFNDQTMPGDGTNPIIQERLANAAAPLQKPLATFEFYDQVGLLDLANRLDGNVVRVHAIAENELHKYLNVRDAVSRYNLAATERNIRYIYVRFQGLINPAASMLSNMELIEFVHEGLTNEGFIVGNPDYLPEFTIPLIPMFLLGAGVIAAGGWLIALAFEPFFGKKKWRIPYFILMILGLAAWGVGLHVLPTLARKLFALAAAVFFPSLGLVLVLKRRGKWTASLAGEFKVEKLLPGLVRRSKALLQAFVQFLLLSAFTIAGALIMSALLAEPTFMLKLNGFVGVKLAHIIPLTIVPFTLWLRETDWFSLLSGTVKSNVRLWQLGVCMILIAGVAIYIIRTGNESPEAVFPIELTVRQTLDNWLGVRPRTTEFLIGHPLMIVMLYYGYRFSMFPILMAGLMGQISLINTYAHIHTPITISLVRSGHGLWMGMLIGIVAIIILELVFHRLRIVNSRRLNPNPP